MQYATYLFYWVLLDINIDISCFFLLIFSAFKFFPLFKFPKPMF